MLVTNSSPISPYNQSSIVHGQTPMNRDREIDKPTKETVFDTVSLSSTGKGMSKAMDTEETKNNIQESDLNLRKLDAEVLQELLHLQKRDTEVRAHEQAHLSAAGQYAAGGARFSYATGPDGKRYAVSGEVPIDMSKESTPQETILKMQIIKRSALAPASPSSADRQIAAQASISETQARRELQSQVAENTQTGTGVETAKESSTNNIFMGREPNQPHTPFTTPENSYVSQNSRQLILKSYAAHSL